MRIFLITAFPEMFQGPFSESILKRAIDRKQVGIRFVYLRDYAGNVHHTIDDVEFGGSTGMIYKPEPIFEAFEDLNRRYTLDQPRIILTNARGRKFDQEYARDLTSEKDLVFICGHYKDIDYRISEHLCTDEISIGDYIVTGGELPAMVMIDAIVRLLPGVLGNTESWESDSFQTGLLDSPRYTRPALYRNYAVPEVLVSGNHKKIADWRRKMAEELTRSHRPDLWEKYQINLSGKV